MARKRVARKQYSARQLAALLLDEIDQLAYSRHPEDEKAQIGALARAFRYVKMAANELKKADN